MKILTFIFVFLCAGFFAESVTLYNDSPFELTAVIQAANGKVLGQRSFHPGEQSTWSSDQSSTKLDMSYNESVSLTPFTVIWKCSYEGFYAMCSNVSPGSLVSANTCPGPHYCRPKPEKKDSNKTKE